MNEKEIDRIIHEIASIGQSFHSYHKLLDNPSINISHRKLSEICGKCAKKCLEIRQIVITEEVE